MKYHTKIEMCPKCNYPKSPGELDGKFHECLYCYSVKCGAKNLQEAIDQEILDDLIKGVSKMKMRDKETIRKELLLEIRKERERQIRLAHGGDTDEFDKTNTFNDWVAFINFYASKGAAKIFRNQKDDEMNHVNRSDANRFRANMVKVAALALAALETYESGQYGD